MISFNHSILTCGIIASLLAYATRAFDDISSFQTNEESSKKKGGATHPMISSSSSRTTKKNEFEELQMNHHDGDLRENNLLHNSASSNTISSIDLPSNEEQTIVKLHMKEENNSKMSSMYSCYPRSRTTEETLWIAVPAWNKTKGLEKCLDSIISQKNTGFKKVHVVVFEDYSEDMFTNEQKQHYQNIMRSITFLRNDGPQKYGSAYGKWKIFEYIRKESLPNEYTLIVDGDDALSDEDALRYMHDQLKAHKPWFAWGQHNGVYNHQCKDLHWLLHSKLLNNKQIRKANWSFCHPRVFKSHLLHHLTVADFQRDDGQWLQKATDRPFIYKFMELAGTTRIKFLGHRPLYNYTFDDRNGLKVFSEETIFGDRNLVISRPPAQVQVETIHVISCVYNRKNTLEFLSKLAQSAVPPNHFLRIHICNNSPERQLELTEIANNVVRELQYHKQAHFISKVLQGKTNFNVNISIDVVDMGGNYGGYSRFLLAQQIMRKEIVDYIIMIDDDQYVRTNTIAEVYSQRQPNTYKTWYGKTWRKDDEDYWSAYPSILARPSIRASIDQSIVKYQYGGTGMSIIDASAFLFGQLFELEDKYKFLEDMWLSHVVNIMDWEISRLFIYFDEHTEASYSGQYTELKSIKNEFFAKLHYFQCGSGGRMWENTTRRTIYLGDRRVNKIVSVILILSLLLLRCVHTSRYIRRGTRHLKKR